MRIAQRAVSRLAFAGWLAGAAMFLAANPTRAATPSEKTLPSNTALFFKIENAASLREALNSSQIGQLIADPALKPIKDEISAKMEDANKKAKEKVGLTIDQLLELPQGQVFLAVIPKDDPKVPVSIIIAADAGKNASAMQDVLSKTTKEAENDKAKVTTETYQGIKITIVSSPPKEGEEKDNQPMVWASKGSVFYVTSDVATMKDVLGHSEGRDDSLAASESFAATQKKIGGKDCGVTVYLDVTQFFKMVTSSPQAQANAQQIEAMLQLTGLTGVKSIAATVGFGVGEYDRLTKVFVYSPGPAQGVLKVFGMPKANLKPQAWVPATAASYRTYSWDLDGAYAAINELGDMIIPGVIANLEKQIAGPDGKGLSFKDDVFGPLGDRVTMVSDFKKPVTENSQRGLIAIDLEDAKAFQNTLNTIFDLAKVSPKKREFQGTTIYDVELPENLGAGQGVNLPTGGTVSLAIAKDTFFIATEPTILEQVLRSGGASLAENPAYQSVTKHMPAQASMASYEKPEEQARVLYDAVKSGQFDKAVDQARAAAGKQGAKPQLFDPAKLPEFSVFSKYLTQGGSFGIMDEDGFTVTLFSLKKASQP
jgi:hypothetical protein